MNLPNILTVLRLVLTVALIVVLQQPGLAAKLAALALFSAAAFTDFYDGYYARKHGIITNFGKIMDPIADKFLMLSAFFVFMVMVIMPEWMFYCIAVREIGITAFRFAAMKYNKFLPAEKMGKYKTVLQVVLIFVILIWLSLKDGGALDALTPAARDWIVGGINVLMWITVILTVGSGLSYLWNNRRALAHV